MFDLERFIDDCRRIATEQDAQKATRERVAEGIRDAREVLSALGEPSAAGIQTLYRAADLTILNVIWAPLMTLMPHNHNMWAVIGIYTGREDNIFWRRRGKKIEAVGARALCAGDAEPLGKDIVHSVTNPIERFTGAIHIYGGDFFASDRSEWNPETLAEQPFNFEKNMRLFQEANTRFRASSGAKL